MELRDYLNVLRARLGIIILSTIVAGSVALAVSMTQKPVYRSSARVLVSERDAGASMLGQLGAEFSSQPERALATQAQLVVARPIAEAAIRKLGLEVSPDSLLDSVEVETVGQTNIIMISAWADSPVKAAAVANAFADEYVGGSRERQRAAIREAVDEVETRLDEAEKSILQVGEKIRNSPRSGDYAAELQVAMGAYTNLAERLEELKVSERLESGSGVVVQPAVADDNPVAPAPVRNTVFGFAAGMILGLLLAFLLEYLDDTIKSSEDAERIYGAPILGTVPADKMDKGQKRHLALIEAPGSSSAEAYRVLRNSLDYVNFEHDLTAILVTSAAPGEGKSTVAANLSVALAQAGKKVVLVSTDFRRPTTDQFFSVNNHVGLSDVLLGTHTLKAALQRSSDDQLLVVNAGKMPPNPSELLGSRKMEEVVASLKEWADWIVIDSPPILAVADPVSAARWADGVLMVSKASSSTRDAGKKAVELLNRAGAKVAGVIVWGLEEGKGGHGYGNYAGGYYYYRSYYGAGEKNRRTSDGATTSQRVGRVLTRVFTALFAFGIMLALIAVILFLLDGYYAWGLRQFVQSMGN